MITSATLKRPWRSPRGKLYPPGSTFKLTRRLPKIKSSIYDFTAPGIGWGWVVLPDKIFKQLTEEERYLRDARRKLIEEHMEATKHPFK